MANAVYANGMEVSCKASNGKSICSFPDVCFTPPQTPATPPGVPIPYPNTAMASDTTDGSSTVMSSGEQIMLKDQSDFKQSTGDEAGCAPKKNVVTSKIQGAAYFVAWSMDVKVEGENVVRHMDLTTHNHGSQPAGAPPQLHIALQAMGAIPECARDAQAVKDGCDPWKDKAKCPEDTEAKIDKAEMAREAATRGSAAYKSLKAQVRQLYKQYAREIEGNDCRRFLRCVMVPYKDVKKVGCAKQTGDHLVEQATVNNLGTYDINEAPTALVEGPSFHVGTHGLGHEGRTAAAKKARGDFDLEKSSEIGADTHRETFPHADCDPVCVKKQLIEGHKGMGINAGDKVRKPTLNSHHNREFKPEWEADMDELAKDLA